MPTAASWTERLARPLHDVAVLLRFRAATVRRRRTARVALGLFALLTVVVAVAPAYLPGAVTSSRAVDIAILLPTGLVAFLGIALVSAVASGGGRELLPRDQGAPHPISPAVDHLGSLLLAPLNIAWVLQAWILLGSAAYGQGPTALPTLLPVVVLWILAATALAQVLAWSVEAVRRRSHGVAAVRALGLVVGALLLWLHLSGRLGPLLDQVPTRALVVAGFDGFGATWLLAVLAELALLVGATLLGVVPATYAARRSPRDELRLESAARAVLPHPRTDLAGLVRTDRSSVWRTVPMRRGITVLAVGPGVVALAGGLPWETMTVLPGLVASGGALLFGVNAWCLDGRGALWRESLPVSPGRVFTARAVVLAEFLLLASAVTLVLASLRAGAPTATELSALVAAWLVVTLQVVAASLRWSDQRPFAVDLRSARATPAPPLLMVGYSSRLAVSTTLTSLVFSGLARADAWEVPLIAAVPFLAWSGSRLLRTRNAWLDPVRRARVVAAVAA